MESAWLALLAAAMGALFAWWAAPFVVSRINPPDNPTRLFLPADWRVIGFGLALTVGVMLLFGLMPALRASAINPNVALRGGGDPHSRRRLSHALIGLQVAFCFLVLFVAGLFAATFEQLSHRPTGFSAEGLLAVDTVTQHAQLPVFWDQVAQHLRTLPGVETVALAGWPLLGHGAWNSFISVNGAPPGPVLAYLLSISPGWLDAMKIRLIDGRDFRPDEKASGTAIVNETFARQYFDGQNPIGKQFARGDFRYQVVGLIADTPYRSMREPILPVAYFPFQSLDRKGEMLPIHDATFMVRISGSNPNALVSTLRREVPLARGGFRVTRIRAQADLVRAQTLRERLLAMLGLFFAAVALLLAGIGLYGVLDYSVLQRRREIGIRVAIGAPAGNIAVLVTRDVFAMVFAGAIGGMVLGMAPTRYLETLLYQVKPGDPAFLVLPSATILAAALLAALPAVIHAMRIDPVEMLRAE